MFQHFAFKLSIAQEEMSDLFKYVPQLMFIQMVRVQWKLNLPTVPESLVKWSDSRSIEKLSLK